MIPALAAVWAATGCSRGEKFAVRPLRTTIVIMDFTVPEDFKTHPHRAHGWWFGAHSLHHNRNAGAMFAEVLTEEMRRGMDWVNLLSRLDVQRYFARKRQTLMSEFPSLTDDQADEMLGQVSPLAYARELGADRVIIGRVVRGKTFFQKTVKYWSSTVEIECSMLDVESGQTVWQYSDSRTGRLDSQKAVMEKMAQRLVKDMRRNYFLDPRRQAPA